MEISPEMRKSIDEIKAELGKGEVVCRPRQTGKTQALLEFVHEHNPGGTNIITCTIQQRYHLEKTYRERYPQDKQPRFVFFGTVSDGDVVGTNREWATDEIWPSAVVRKAPAYEFREFIGAVGTPMCMDMHSK